MSAQQQVLFGPPPPDLRLGYRGSAACTAAGITYRQLDHWARTGLITPSISPAHGSGSTRLYGFTDIVNLRLSAALLAAGVGLDNVRAALAHVKTVGVEHLSGVTLVCDRVQVFEADKAENAAAHFARGPGMFSIAVARIWADVADTLAGYTAAVSAAPDELAARRRRAR